MDREIFAREISSKRKRLEDLAQQIWENPEEPFQETIAARLVAELLEQEGFQVERGAGGVPTALRAVWGHGSPVIGLLGEYDSLPQMSQKATDHKEPMVENGYGHGCGHNLLGCGHGGSSFGYESRNGGTEAFWNGSVLWMSGRGGAYRKTVYGQRRLF